MATLAIRLKSTLATLCLAMISLGLCACQTPQRKLFETVRVGMDKSIIVETVGSPTITRRVHGQDHWIYKFRDGEPKDHLVREVHFENGLAVYVGPTPQPKVSAAEQDKVNAEIAAADEERWRSYEASREDRLGASRMTSEPEDALSRKLRHSLYGIETPADEERRKQAPSFVPVQ